MIATLCFMAGLSGVSYSAVKLKFIVVNPSSTQRDQIPIKYILPQEIEPADIIDAGGLTVRYDVDEKKYFVSGTVELEPSETRVFEVEVKDIWKIPEEDITALREQAEEQVKVLEGTDSYKVASSLKDGIIERLDSITSSQDQNNPIQERVKDFYLNKKSFEIAKHDIYSLEGLIKDAGKEEEKTITITLETENPSKTEKRTTSLKYYLPPEVNKKDIVDSGDFDVAYDLGKSQAYVEKSIELEAGQSLVHHITVKDVWRVKNFELDSLNSEMDKMMDKLAGTPYEKIATFISGDISKVVNEIRESQKLDLPLKERIALYRENIKKLEASKSNIQRLNELLLKLELQKGGEAGERKEIHEKDITFGGGKAEGKGGGIGKGLGTALGQARGQTVEQRGGGIKAIRGLKGIILVSESIFKGWKPDIATTWKIIFSVMGFLAVLSSLFYGVWLVQSKKKEQTKPIK
ncbi:MAG: hypothetical protein JW994_04720 [Candidatus Omnitrophica bacterium]|nr:hypothetical protein [Candidatus Omnitrophota bacterium]